MTDQSIPERPSIKDLAAALSKAQGEMKGAAKDSEATVTGQTKRKYADLAAVWSAIREPLTKNGLSVVQLLRSVQGGVEVETILLHNSGQQISDVFGVPVAQPNAQGYGSAATYARRYALMAMVGVAPEDDDGESAGHGAPGQAGAGTDFRPAGPRKFQGNGNMAAEAERDGTLDTSRPKGSLTTPAGKKTPAEKALDWTDKAIATLNLSAQTSESLDKYWKDNKDKVEWMEMNAPDQYERLSIAFDNARDAAKAKVSA